MEQQEPIIRQNAAGGKGHIVVLPLLTEAEMKDKCRLFARVTIPAGCSLGVHMHTGDGECYYILSGRGRYTEDGKVREVGAGDVTFCADGHSHGMETIGDEDLVFLALIICS